MAANYSWISYTDPNGRLFRILKTSASNIKPVNLYRATGACQEVSESGYYGMNSSFFNSTPSAERYPAILNIAYQGGNNVGCGIVLTVYGSKYLDGVVNVIGSSLIYWTGSSLGCASDVLDSSSSVVPKGSNSWAQGGIGLYLCDRNWQDKFSAEPNTGDYTFSSAKSRTSILINKSTKSVYLIACGSPVTIGELRTAIMSYAGLTEGGSAGSWAAIMTDGGQSTQPYCGEGSCKNYMGIRSVPQILALKNKA